MSRTITISKEMTVYTGMKEKDLKQLHIHMCHIGHALIALRRMLVQYGPMDNRGKLVDAHYYLNKVDDKLHSYFTDIEDSCGQNIID